MTIDSALVDVLAEYPQDCWPTSIESLGLAGGFSGARFWRLETPSGTLCLRCWPRESPSLEQLQFIQAVLWHVTREGFEEVPLPRETQNRAGFVRKRDFFWELAPWLPGQADFSRDPTTVKLQAAMVALARFHRAAESFPLPETQADGSPGIRQRRAMLDRWRGGDLDDLTTHVRPGVQDDLLATAQRILALFPQAVDGVARLLESLATTRVAIQPCIRDVWHAHILFTGERVTGLVDYGAMQADNVATDVARLLGSMATDHRTAWRDGLSAYQTVRSLSPVEIRLLEAFDQSTVLMAGLNWIDWIFRQRRTFEHATVIPQRLDEIRRRLENLAGGRRAPNLTTPINPD